MKKTVSIVLAALMAAACLTLSSCGSESVLEEPRAVYTVTKVVDGEEVEVNPYEGTSLNVFNWGVYISDGSEGTFNVNQAFENLTGIKVNYTTYESNEAMYSKLKSGAVSYDIVIPSDYMIQRMISEDMLQPLDFSKLTNYDLIDEQYKNLFYDPDNAYSVPYNVGMVGLIYNKTMVEGTPDSWSVMWDPTYAGDILIFDNPRDAFGIAQFLCGVDVNSENKSDWDAAAEKLKELKKIWQGRVMDQVFAKMEGGNAAIAPYYAGDYLTMVENNPDLGIVFPKEGTNIFVDAVCVPKNASNYDAAMLYINFLMEPEVALANAEYICYASPNTSVSENPDYTYYGEEILYPSEVNRPVTEYFHDVSPEIRSYYEKLWEEVIID